MSGGDDILWDSLNVVTYLLGMSLPWTLEAVFRVALRDIGSYEARGF